MWIECGIINYKLLIPFIYPIFHPIRIIIHKDAERAVLESFVTYIGYLLSGFIYLIIKCRMGKKNELLNENQSNNEIKPIVIELNSSASSFLEDSEEETKAKIDNILSEKIMRKETNQIDFEKIKLEKRESKRKHLFIFILAIIYLIPMNLNAYKMGSSASLLFAIFSYVLFSRLILGMKIFSHQIFSLIIILVSNITTILLELIGNGGENIFLSLLFIVIIVTLFGLFDNFRSNSPSII